ncbi:hypothetical protein HU200_061079 [Digitaria exilis]|uniref:BHLH domain-containing protein n=1 Tax=Digitaria exilis TaxID=1010633 RepID=A0A835AI09_9POAL|nr:hypothetical protein HU200_061079 [Digitaria exilis]
MNQYVPDWSSSMGDAFAAFNGEDDGLIELLWCNGHVVMQSQAPRKPTARPEKAPAAAVAMPVQDDEAAPWFQYPPAEDTIERDLFFELFGDAQAASGACKEEDDECAGDAIAATPQRRSSQIMPPPQEKAAAYLGDLGYLSDGVELTAAAAVTEAAAESSMLTIGSSFCGSNHVQTPPPRVAAEAAGDAGGGGAKARDAATVTSSSMWPRSCTTIKAGNNPGAAAHRSGKRKQQSDAAMETEDAEFEPADATCEPAAQKLTAAKRRRAAEVHNLSERRRRDRINEKMKALQELIPHCNKTDKASMLDEAIEYLKSLQLQLQMMWMGGGMAAAAAPVMFPAGVHQYMQRMVAPPHHVASMPRMPFVAPPAVQSSPVADPYARYLAVDHLQPPPMQHYLQGMGFYQQQQQSSAPPPPSLPAATARTSASDGILHKKCGTQHLHKI